MTITINELNKLLKALTPGRGGITSYSMKLDKEIYYFKGKKLARTTYNKRK